MIDAGPGVVLSHESAARWWGLTGCALDPISVVGMSSSRRRSALVDYHRVRRLPPTWMTELDGVPVARPELVALHLFAVCRYERAERLTEALWSRRLLSGRSLRRFIADMGRCGRNGSAGVRRYLESRPGDHVPAASGLESRTIQILDRAGITVRRQVDTGSDEAWTGQGGPARRRLAGRGRDPERPAPHGTGGRQVGPSSATTARGGRFHVGRGLGVRHLVASGRRGRGCPERIAPGRLTVPPATLPPRFVSHPWVQRPRRASRSRTGRCGGGPAACPR